MSADVVLTMMLKYVAAQCVGQKISLNEHDMKISYACCLTPSMTVPVAKASQVTVLEVGVDMSVGVECFDIGLRVGETSWLYIDIAHEKKPVKSEESIEVIVNELKESRSGVLVLSCEDLAENIVEDSSSYSEAVLAAFLGACRLKWRYHPRSKKIRETNMADHKCWVPERKTQGSTTYAASTVDKTEPVEVRCVVCLSRWLWKPGTARNCEQCKTHLYVNDVSQNK